MWMNESEVVSVLAFPIFLGFGGLSSCAAAAVWSQPARSSLRLSLSGFEQEDGDLAEVEVDEVLGLVCDVRAEVAAYDAVPRGVVLLVELLLDERSDILPPQ